MYKLSRREFKSISEIPDLRSLNLDLTMSSEFSSQDFQEGFSLKEKSKLVELNLTLMEVEDLHLDSIGRSCQNLEDLSLEEILQGSDTSKVTLSGIKDLMKNCPKLKRLKLLALKKMENLKKCLSEYLESINFSIHQENGFTVLTKNKKKD